MTKEDSTLEQTSLLVEILMWLWDVERSKIPLKPCVVLVTENVEYASFFREFRSRGSVFSVPPISLTFFSVFVVCICGFLPHSGHQILKDFTSNCDALLEQRTLIDHTMLWRSGEYQSAQEIASIFIHPFLSTLEQQPDVEEVRRTQEMSRPSEALQYGEQLSQIANLHHEPSQDSDVSKYYSNHIFSQSSWQSGPQSSFSSDEMMDSHVSQRVQYPSQPSYHENLTTEQLQLQEELMNAIYAYNVKVAISTLRKMYTKQSKTFRIPVILSTILPDTAAMITNGRTDLVNIALCFMLDCIQWCFGVHKGENFESFKYKMNANIARWLLRESVKKGIPSVVSSTVYNATIKLFNQILDNYLELNFTYELLQSMNVTQPIPRMIPYLHIWLNSTSNSMKHRVHEFLYEHPEFSQYFSADPNNIPPSIQQQIAFGEAEASSSYLHDQELEGRLLYLLSKSGKGELGARIPTLYREEFGEPIRLRGRKLKDILVGHLQIDYSNLTLLFRNWSG